MLSRLLLLAALLPACGGSSTTTPAAPASSEPTPPVAEPRPHTVSSPHGDRVDPYYWLRDDSRKDPDVLAYLKAENDYAAAMLAPTAKLQDQLYGEIVGRIVQDDSTVPELDNGYWYYARYETGKEYPIHARKRGTLDAAEEIILDANQRAAGHEFYSARGLTVSPNNRLLAFVEDTVGRNQYALRIIDLDSGKLLADRAENITGSLAWSADSKTLFYVGKDPKTLRSNKVVRHRLGSPASDDVVVYQEDDESFYTYLGATKSRKYVAVVLWSTVATEARLIPTDQPDAEPAVFIARERGHEYSIEHIGDRFVMRTNWQAENFRVVEVTPGQQNQRDSWVDLVPHRDDVLVEAFDVTDSYLAVNERAQANTRIWIKRAGEAEGTLIDAGEPAYSMALLGAPDASTREVRYIYQSMTTPATTFDYDPATGKKLVRKKTEVRGDFDASRYVTERVWAPARDGSKIPVSVVYRRDRVKLDGSAPLMQVGYGAYGASSRAYFSIPRLSMLDRGWVYATAHVRGGQEMGRRWYEQGKLMHKMNSFTDFIDVTEELVRAGYGARDRVFAGGGSAGGLLMGAVMNLRPELYRGVVANVPFVDVVTTMLDESIPLTTNEYDEWGDPRKKEYYDYLVAYSPYDNVAAKSYPSLLVTTGLWDSQVQYFEPAKWVARLRAQKTDDNLLILSTNMSAGHGGKSGRYQQYREIARDYAFMLLVLERPDSRARTSN